VDDTNGGGLASARAHSNIALAKYWGKRDSVLNIPAVGSISITLDALFTDTTVRFDDQLESDELLLGGVRQLPSDGSLARVSLVLDLVRELSGSSARAAVTSVNNFPTGAGLASSASGFAALVVAACSAAGLELRQRELSILARRGSASAARSILGGFVELPAGTQEDGSDSYAQQVLDAADWPLSVVVAITDRTAKTVSSTVGMQSTSASSPFYPAWLELSSDSLDLMRRAIHSRDFEQLGELTEHSCLALHSLMFTTRPALIYWNAATVAAIHTVRALRGEGVPVYFTIDAGPQVKALCLPRDADTVASVLSTVPGVVDVIRSGLGPAARVLPESSRGAS
jgi:diphosphomevalonate decarboxylase